MRTLTLLLFACGPSEPSVSDGPPLLFADSCARYALQDGVWVPQPGFVRTSTWIYAREGPDRVVALLNLSPIAESTSDDDLAGYPQTSFDPAVFGCGEHRASVERLLGNPVFTTQNSEVDEELRVDGLRFVSAYYLLDGGPAGVVVLYANDRLISMVSS